MNGKYSHLHKKTALYSSNSGENGFECSGLRDKNKFQLVTERRHNRDDLFNSNRNMDFFDENGIKINTSDNFSSVSIFGKDKEIHSNAPVNNRKKVELETFRKNKEAKKAEQAKLQVKKPVFKVSNLKTKPKTAQQSIKAPTSAFTFSLRAELPPKVNLF